MEATLESGQSPSQGEVITQKWHSFNWYSA